MPKIKTKSSAKKRFSFTATGKIIAKPAFKQHNLRKRPTKMKRQARGTMLLQQCDMRMVNRLMPNG